MARRIDPTLAEILRKYGADPATDIWDCHGQWVAYHRALERIAVKANVMFDMPQVLEASGTDKSVAICVRGSMLDRSEWSIGEAAPGNNKNAYPYAMAEKRAKDRVILKLIGLHGLVYSEEEMDGAEKPPNGKANGNGKHEDFTQADADRANADDIIGQVRACRKLGDIDAVGRQTKHIYDALPKEEQVRVARVGQDRRAFIMAQKDQTAP
jgi:hypothetical protein